MYKQRQYRLASGLAALSFIACQQANALEFDFYGSLRFQAEAVSPDNENELDSYTGWRDAYSQLGFNATHALNDSVTTYVNFSVPLDLPNKAVQGPWNQDSDVRVAQVGIKGDFGNLMLGQMWLPYYNAIAYPVDMFSSYYSGFATYSSFRKGDTIAYYSPSFSGLSGAIGYSQEKGALESNGVDTDNRLQATLSYKFNDVTISGGYDDLGGANNLAIIGTSLMWQATPELYIGAKYEQHKSDIDTGYGADGDHAMNLYAGYTLGKNTFKAMVADVNNYGENILHLGWDHQYQDDLKFFVEYYSEEETAAITEQHGGMKETCWSCSGGHVIAAGLRYDFRAP